MTMFEITSGITRKMIGLTRRLSQKVDTLIGQNSNFQLKQRMKLEIPPCESAGGAGYEET